MALDRKRGAARPASTLAGNPCYSVDQEPVGTAGMESIAMQEQTTIIIADDHPLFRGALRQAVGSLMPDAKVIEASGMDDVNATLSASKEIDLNLLDLTMPGVQGFSGLIYLRA
jgi:response regulator RpfG family c-di-GMP phosphodiesterase